MRGRRVDNLLKRHWGYVLAMLSRSACDFRWTSHPLCRQVKHLGQHCFFKKAIPRVFSCLSFSGDRANARWPWPAAKRPKR